MSVLRRWTRRGIDLLGNSLSQSTRSQLGGLPIARRMVAWSRTSSENGVDPNHDEEPSGDLPVELLGNRPSYRYKLEELKRRHAALQALGLRDPLDSINDKYRAYTFADRHGLDHPEVFGSFDSVTDVTWNELPDRFVLKTRWGSSNQGVKALVRETGTTFYDLLRSRSWSVGEIVDHHHRMESQRIVSRAMFAEELILKPGTQKIADDWKFYCFDGVVGLCMQRDVRATGDTSQWRFKFWDRDWKDMGPIKFADRLDPDLVPPNDAGALLDLAEMLSAIIGQPFVRIDLFESKREPVLGEFTPRPAPPEIFVPEIDEMLGRLWEEAQQRLFAREITAGWWSHIQIE